MTAEQLAALVAAWLNGEKHAHLALADAIEEHGQAETAGQVRGDDIRRWGGQALWPCDLLSDFLNLGSVASIYDIACNLAYHLARDGDDWPRQPQADWEALEAAGEGASACQETHDYAGMLPHLRAIHTIADRLS